MFKLFLNFFSKFRNARDKVLIYPPKRRFKLQKYDKIFLPDFIGTSDDYQTEFESLRKFIKDKGLLIITSINPVWGRLFGFKNTKTPLLYLWFIENLLEISNFKIVKSGYFATPPKVPSISIIFNSLLPKIPKLKRLLPFQFVIARPEKLLPLKKYSVSVVIPMHNEEGNVAECIKQIPKMGKFTEIIIVDDGSTDNTLKIAKYYQKKFKNLRIFSYKPNKGKVWAVKRGFDEASGDILMIWDADRTVSASELPRFYKLFATGQAEYVQGTRLAYPMEKEAMKFVNLLGNLFFGWIYSWILGTRITDTLCGTKVLFKKDYKKIRFGTEPWGDFDLMFGASSLGLKIKELPIHYKARIAGKSKMKTFRYGLVVTKMAIRGFFMFKTLPIIKKVFTPSPLLFIMLIASIVRLTGLMPNIPFHPDEGYTQQATHNLVVDIVSKGDFEPKAYKYGSLTFFVNSLVYLPFLILTYIFYFLNNLSLNSSLAARPFMDTFLEIVYKNGYYIFLMERAITAIFGIASVYLLYSISKQLFNERSSPSGEKIALLGALIFAVVPLHVRDSHYVTTDIPFLFFVLLSFLFMVNIFQTSKLKWYLLAGFFIGVSATVRYYPIAFLVLPIAWILDPKKGKTWLLKIFLSLIFILLGVLICIPFLPFSQDSQAIFKREMENLVLPFYGTSISAYATGLISFLISFGKTPLPDIATLHPGKFLPYHASFIYFTGFGVLPTLASIAGVAIGLIKYPKQSLILLIIPVINFIYISFYMHAVYQRLSIPLLPFLSLFSALFLFYIWIFLNRVIKNKYNSLIFTAILLIILFYPISQSLIASYQCGQESVYTTAKKWMEKNANSNIKLAYQAGLPFPAKEFTDHQESMVPSREFFLEEVRQLGKEYAFFNPESITDYYGSFDNYFFMPPESLLKNSQSVLGIYEYQTRAKLLDKIQKNKMCERTEFYFYKIPDQLPESKNLLKHYSFDTPTATDTWKLLDYGIKTTQLLLLQNTDEGRTKKGSLEYRWTNIAFSAPRAASETINIEGGKTYTLLAWLKSTSDLEPSQRDGYIRLDFYRPEDKVELPGIKVAITPRIFGKSGWKEVKITTQAPLDAKKALISFQIISSKASGSFFIDDVKLFQN